MRKSLRALLLSALVAVFVAPAATAQLDGLGNCKMKFVEYPDSVMHNGVCQGKGRFCMNFYWECDGQPYPIDYRSEPGHLTVPQTRIALLSESDVSAEPSTQLALPDDSCKSRSLFDALDRRQKSHLHQAKVPESSVNPEFLTPATP